MEILKPTMTRCFLLILLMATSDAIYSQEDILFTKKFTKKIKQFDLEFYLPVERWMKASPIVEDEYLDYDLVLHSPPNVEARIIIRRDQDKMFPNIDIVSTISHISSNADDAVIEITEYPSIQSKERYGADFVLYADFTPKESFTTYQNGRILCLYKEGHALIKYIILYDDELDPYFNLPIKFKELENQ